MPGRAFLEAPIFIAVNVVCPNASLQPRRVFVRRRLKGLFELTKEELENWRCQIGISNSIKMGLRYSPMAFTEQGVAMLSSVLNSKRAIQVNIVIMRAFVKLREIMSDHRQLAERITKLENRLTGHDENFRVVFEAIRQMLETDERPKRKMGF